jgi:hypothetical protein
MYEYVVSHGLEQKILIPSIRAETPVPVAP